MDRWLKGLVKFNSETLSPSHGSNILMCCLPVEHQEMCVSHLDGVRRWVGRVGLLTPMPRPSASLSVAHPACLFAQWWSETYHRCSNRLPKDPHGLREGSYDLEAVRHLHHQLPVVSPGAQWVTVSEARWPSHLVCLFPTETALLIADILTARNIPPPA